MPGCWGDLGLISGKVPGRRCMRKGCFLSASQHVFPDFPHVPAEGVLRLWRRRLDIPFLHFSSHLEKEFLLVGFTCKVCTNLCVSTDGYLSCLEVTNTRDLYQAVLEMFHKYDAAKHIHLMQSLGNTSMTEHQFCQLLGRMRLYQSLPQGYQKDIPKMLLTDTQVNNVAKAYINDENFGSLGNDLSMWKFYNLLTGANKSSYIDSFLDRAYNATELATGICSALHGDDKYQWFLS